MHHAKRVVYENRPYLVRFDGEEPRVFGPFPPGAEPTLAMTTSDRDVDDPELIGHVLELAERSPPLPFDPEAQAGSPFS